MKARRRGKSERELHKLRQRHSQLLAELEEVSLRASWLELDDAQEALAEGLVWRKQAEALRAAIGDLEQRIFALELELL